MQSEALPSFQSPIRVRRSSIGWGPTLAVSAGCAHRLFPAVLMDFVSEVRNLIGDIGSRFVPARRCYQHTNSYADPQSDG